MNTSDARVTTQKPSVQPYCTVDQLLTMVCASEDFALLRETISAYLVNTECRNEEETISKR